MLDHRQPHRLLCWIGMLFLLSFVGCGLRPANVSVSAPGEPSHLLSADASPQPSPTPEEAKSYTVEFYYGEERIDSQTVLGGELPCAPGIRALRIQGWTDENGQSADPEALPVTGDARYYAQVDPLLREDARFLFADEHGLLRPEALFTRSDAARAVAALAPESASDLYPAPEAEQADEPLLRTEFVALMEQLFDPEAADAILQSVFPYESDTVTRVVAANGIAALLGPMEVPEDAYYPDVRPDAWGRNALLRAAGPGPLTPEALQSGAKDGYLWIEGYLYRLEEDGYFLVGEFNGLSFDGNGRFTSGDEELDRYVAETLVQYLQPDRPRLEDLRAIYYHVKNDFQYLTRNYYDSGATGWENQEALTLFSTGKGNCYCYAGVFRSLARGLGYNAVCYSGTMGNQDQPHAWTEILREDGRVFICDPEIEMNYWWVAAMNNDPSLYTDNFMMPVEASAGWNYQAVGRY